MKLQVAILLSAVVLLNGCGPSAEQKTEAARIGAISKKWERNNRTLKSLSRICARRLKENLKDPDLYKLLNDRRRIYNEVQPSTYHNGSKIHEDYDAAVNLEYNTTNSYGGRIRNKYMCLFMGRNIVSIL